MKCGRKEMVCVYVCEALLLLSEGGERGWWSSREVFGVLSSSANVRLSNISGSDDLGVPPMMYERRVVCGINIDIRRSM